MFAGPNGSGKSTLKSVLRKELLGIYLNPDDIEQEIRRQGFLELSAYGVESNEAEALSFFRDSPFLNSVGMATAAGRIMDAIRRTNRAYIFDNSGDNQEKHTWLAEITEGRKLEMKTDEMPAWFKRAVLDKADG